jgi:DNA-binding IclR family transcriptional regulator
MTVPRVNAVERAFNILELLVEKSRKLTISEISRRLNIPKSSTYLIVRTLERRGYVQRDEEGRYGLSFRLLKFSHAVLQNLEVRQLAVPFLKQLVHMTGCSVRLGCLEQGEVVIVEKEDTPGLIRINSWIGRRMEAYCTALGKALLAFSPEEQLEGVIARGLRKHTKRTITEAEKLKLELERVRRLGYALNDEENAPEVRAIAAPIFDHQGKVVAALGIAGTARQIPTEAISKLAGIVKEKAKQLSKELGFEAV